MKTSTTLSLFTWLFCVVLLGAVLTYKTTSNKVEFDADILNLLNIDDTAGLLAKVASEPYRNKALLLIQHEKSESTKDYLRRIKPELDQLPRVSSVSFNPSNELDISALVSSYADFPLAFLSDQAQQAKTENNYGFIVERYMQQLSQPANPLITLSINEAPLLNLADWFASRVNPSGWQQDDEFLYVEQEGSSYYPIFITFDESASQINNVVGTVNSLEYVLNRQANLTPDSIITSGFIFHNAAVTDRAQFEMQLFTSISVIGVLLLTLINFRSLLPLLSIMILIASSALAGMTALVLVFSKIHLLSLVFAISLIGIAVDYGYHILFTAKYTKLENKKLSQYIAPALLMGGGTTLVSYLLLLMLPIPLLKQVAVFVGSGVLFAIFTGLTIIVWTAGKTRKTSELQTTYSAPKKGFKALIATMCLVCIVAIPQWKFEDDIAIFNSTPQHLLDNEVLVSELIGNQQYPRFVYVQGDDKEQVLQRIELTRKAFNDATDTKYELRGIDIWLPSQATQASNDRWLKQGIAENRLDDIVSYLSTDSVDSIMKTPDSWFTEDDLNQSIRELYPQFSQQDDKVVGILSYMGPLDDELFETVQSRLDFSISYYDQPAQFSAAFTKLRMYIMSFLGMAAIALVALMVFRYGLYSGLYVAAIPAITAITALALTVLISGYVTIFNLLACILILALSIDYIVFLREHGRRMHVLKSITLSAATSGLAFGIMIFSNTPAIWQFGLTVLLGVSFGWAVCHLLPVNLSNKKHQDELNSMAAEAQS